MSEYFEDLTRWDATHTKSIKIDYQQEFFDSPIKDDAKYFGLTILTGHERVADVFGAELEKDSSVIDRAVLDAIATGDHVFYIEYGRHSSEWVHILDGLPKRTWDAGCAGVILVHKDAWHDAMPRHTFVRKYVARVLEEAFSERVTAYLNGWVYEATIKDEDDCVYLDGYLSPKDALKDAMSLYPEICYKPADFDVTISYCLRG